MNVSPSPSDDYHLARCSWKKYTQYKWKLKTSFQFLIHYQLVFSIVNHSLHALRSGVGSLSSYSHTLWLLTHSETRYIIMFTIVYGWYVIHHLSSFVVLLCYTLFEHFAKLLVNWHWLLIALSQTEPTVDVDDYSFVTFFSGSLLLLLLLCLWCLFVCEKKEERLVRACRWGWDRGIVIKSTQRRKKHWEEKQPARTVCLQAKIVMTKWAELCIQVL